MSVSRIHEPKTLPTMNPYLNYWDRIDTIDGEHPDMMIGAQHENPCGHGTTLYIRAVHRDTDPLHRPGDRRGHEAIAAARERRRRGGE